MFTPFIIARTQDSIQIGEGVVTGNYTGIEQMLPIGLIVLGIMLQEHAGINLGNCGNVPLEEVEFR